MSNGKQLEVNPEECRVDRYLPDGAKNTFAVNRVRAENWTGTIISHRPLLPEAAGNQRPVSHRLIPMNAKWHTGSHTSAAFSPQQVLLPHPPLLPPSIYSPSLCPLHLPLPVLYPLAPWGGQQSAEALERRRHDVGDWGKTIRWTTCTCLISDPFL